MLDKQQLYQKFQKEWEKHYNIDFFKEHGFVRKLCKNCKRHFWTLDNEREICMDSTCSSFDFIGKKIKKISYIDCWKAIEKYFNSTGHETVARYPVVSRWRKDLFFTNASIVCFQPYVVQGIVKPPANPLIIAQPCLRFNDIENVGITGQHYTSFIMIGQHAFNNDEKGLFYWKDEALYHDFMYLTKVLNVPKEAITFQEDVWLGGGNFGPSIEYCSYGLELGNCVFMQFKVLPNKRYEELKTKVIDMGAGLERLAWYSNGTANSYETTFEKTLQHIRKHISLDLLDEKTLLLFSKHAGMLDVDSSLYRENKKKLEQILGIDYYELMKKLRYMSYCYAICDHLRTIMYACYDGCMPSNAAGGYNLRILSRRIFAFNELLKLNIDDVIEKLAKEFKDFDYALYEIKDTVIDLMHNEKRKFLEKKKKSEKLLARFIENVKKGKEKPTLQSLRVLYESHGITLEEIKELFEKENIKLDDEIIENFYGKIAKKNEIEVDEKELLLQEKLANYPKTRKLFYEDDKLYSFEATVLGIEDNAIILDKTAFYAESGGQEADKGMLNEANVLDVQIINGVILHYVDKPELFKVGQKVLGKIDVERREQLRRHHSATHLVNAACQAVLGKHVWQHGAHKSFEKAHIDITHYKRLTKEEINKIELLANTFVTMNKPVTKKFYERTEAEKLFGLRIYQGGYVPGKEIRIINMKGIDVEACSGIHVDFTGEVGAIKIIKAEALQDGVQRLEFVAGKQAIKYLQELHDNLESYAKQLSTSLPELGKTALKFFEEWKKEKKQRELLEKELLNALISKYSSDKEQSSSKIIKDYLPYLTKESLLKLAFESGKKKKALFLFANKDVICCVSFLENISAADFLKNILESLQIKADFGGSKKVAFASIKDEKTIKKVLENAKVS